MKSKDLEKWINELIEKDELAKFYMSKEFRHLKKAILEENHWECEICKKEGSVSITVKNTNALGLVMTYDGKNVNFKYSTYSYDISGENFEKENAAIIIYDVISALSNDNTKLHIIDGGVKYEGKTNFGEFILVQNDNSTLKSLAFKNSDFKIVFK